MLILLHGGWVEENSDLLEAIRPLEARYHFIFYDQRGSLRSPCPGSLITFANHIEDVEHLRSELKLAKVHWVGHSIDLISTRLPQISDS